MHSDERDDAYDEYCFGEPSPRAFARRVAVTRRGDPRARERRLRVDVDAAVDPADAVPR